MKIYISLNKIRTIFFFCICLILLGCVSATTKNMAANFGSTAKTLTNEIETNLTKVRISESNLIISNALLDKDLKESNGLESPAIKPESIELRLTLLREITKYADALLIMSSDEEEIRIDKASRDLYGALGALNETIVKQGKTGLGEKDLQLVATATDIVGQLFFEWARLNALKESVNLANPVITEAVNLLKQEVTDKGSWSKSLELSLSTNAINLYNVAQHDINDISERRGMLIEARQLNDQSQSVQSTFLQLNSSLEDLKNSHTALAAALNDDSDINVTKALENLSKLEQELDHIHAFQASLVK